MSQPAAGTRNADTKKAPSGAFSLFKFDRSQLKTQSQIERNMDIPLLQYAQKEYVNLNCL